MIRIEGNRECLYQWDLNQRVVLINITAGVQVHFDTKPKTTQSECLGVFAYEENGNVYANVPNILLQKSGIVSVYIYIEQENKAYTEHHAEIIVLPRPRPASYVYTETEVLTYTSLEKKIIALSEQKLGNMLGTGNAGKLLYVSEDGTVKPLILGDGLEIVNGSLRVTSVVTPQTSIIFESIDGVVTMTGAEFIEQTNGVVLINNATFTDEGNCTILIN